VTNLTIIAVDWGKDKPKRAAYQADLETRRVQSLDIDVSLMALLE